MNIQVMYADNRIEQIDSSRLENLISANMIKQFMRSGTWAVVGEVRMRGNGGIYGGADRRGMYGLTGEIKYKIIA